MKEAKMPHKKVSYEEDGTEVFGEECDGIVSWDIALEGYVCSKCGLYTGVK